MLLLDLYLNKRLADFEARLYARTLQTRASLGRERISVEHLVKQAYNKVY